MNNSLMEIWQAGVDAVRGDPAVRAVLPKLDGTPTQIIAVGKAACDMARPAMEAFPDVPVLIATKHGHGETMPGPATIIQAGHPIPDAASLRAGHAMVQTVQTCAPSDHLLLLVSGGASAVAERLPENVTLEDWQAQTETLVASGADIHEINAHRRSVSQIKGGKLLAQFPGARVTVLAISDVEGDALSVIGSGIGSAPNAHSFDYTAQIVASNAIARAAAAKIASAVQTNAECLFDDVETVAKTVADTILNGAPGDYIFGGEPTVRLPANPGRGGRNQALALLIAQHIAGHADLQVLVAGTDGTDGPTPDAGAQVDGTTWGPGAQDALTRADAGTYLAAQNALITTGPTGTNVMDLVIARKS